MLIPLNISAQTAPFFPFMGERTVIRVTDNGRLGDVIAAAESILEQVHSCPPHVRPWLRGVEAEAERVCVEADGIRRRATSRLVAWVQQGLENEQ